MATHHRTTIFLTLRPRTAAYLLANSALDTTPTGPAINLGQEKYLAKYFAMALRRPYFQFRPKLTTVQKATLVHTAFILPKSIQHGTASPDVKEMLAEILNNHFTIIFLTYIRGHLRSHLSNLQAACQSFLSEHQIPEEAWSLDAAKKTAQPHFKTPTHI